MVMMKWADCVAMSYLMSCECDRRMDYNVWYRYTVLIHNTIAIRKWTTAVRFIAMFLFCCPIYCLQDLAIWILLLEDSEYVRVLSLLSPLPSLSPCVGLNAPIQQCLKSIIRDDGVTAVDDFLVVNRVEERDEVIKRELLILGWVTFELA